MESRLSALIAGHPRAKRFQIGIGKQFASASDEEVLSFCVDGLEENLAILCTFFFETARNEAASGEGILRNDCFVAAVLYLERVHAVWRRTLPSNDERIDCLALIGDLLVDVGRNRKQSRISLRPALVGAYYLALPLKNQRLGRPLFHGLRYEVFLRDRFRSMLTEKATLREITDEVRRTLFVEGSGR